MTVAGWYHAEGDPEGTVRYWDGQQWGTDAVPTPSATPEPEPDPPPETVGYSLVAPPEVTADAGHGAFDMITAGERDQAWRSAEPAAVRSVPSKRAFTPGFRSMATTLSLLKLVPVGVLVLGMGWVLDSDYFTDALQPSQREAFDTGRLLIGLVAAGLGLVVLVQLVAAHYNRPALLLCISLPLAVLDFVFTIILIGALPIVLFVVLVATLICQSMIAFSSLLLVFEK